MDINIKELINQIIYKTQGIRVNFICVNLNTYEAISAAEEDFDLAEYPLLPPLAIEKELNDYEIRII